MKFIYYLKSAWAPLAWVAEVSPTTHEVRVSHGEQVETHSEWFIEGVWDGTFKHGDFDKTDLIFGSGARIRDREVIFVSSGTTVDRLHKLTRGEKTFISNTFPGLLAYLDLPTDLRGYAEAVTAIVRGVDQKNPTFSVRDQPVELLYFHNWVWDGTDLKRHQKPLVQRRLDCYGNYVEFIEKSIELISANSQANERKLKYGLLGSISSGYDSAAASALSIRAGLTVAYTIIEARHGFDDSGLEVGRCLGLDVIRIERSAWQTSEFDDVAVLASGSFFDLPLISISEHARNKILITGFLGGNVWNRDLKNTSENIVRGDNSGQGLTEWRLWVGAIHVPVPFFAVRSIENINRISKSPEMKQWDLKSTYYSRPICRRILEERGVKRDLFGMKKVAVATVNFERRIKPSTEKRFLRMLDCREGLKAGFLSPSMQYKIYCIVVKPIMLDPYKIVRLIQFFQRIIPKRYRRSRVEILREVLSLQRRFAPNPPFFELAVEEMKARYN